MPFDANRGWRCLRTALWISPSGSFVRARTKDRGRSVSADHHPPAGRAGGAGERRPRRQNPAACHRRV